MSHFTVLVIGDNPEEQLAPYQENNMGDCPKKYLKFYSSEEEYREEYETDTIQCVRFPDGTLIEKYDDQFYQKVEDADYGTRKQFVLPEDCELVNIPNKEHYATFEEFVKDWHGSERDSETGEYGYWENPNAKWDWYQLGGRWTGVFKIKEGKEGIQGDPGLLTAQADDGWVDQAYKRDIDFEGMIEESERKAYESFDKFEAAVADVEPFTTTWEEFRESFEDIDKAREAYGEIPFIKATRALRLWDDPVVKFKVREKNPREAYVDEARLNSLSTFAVLVDGKWYERGEMGWWAIVSNEKEQKDWLKELHKLIITSPEDTLFSVFDCHI